MKLFLLLFICCSLILNFGCDNIDEPKISKESFYEKEETTSDSNDSILTQYYLIESTDKNIISLEIPMFCNENKEIKQFVCQYLEEKIFEICGEEFDYTESNVDVTETEYSSYFIDLNHHIVYKTKSFVSIVFDGFLNKKHTAHPTNLYFTLNINLDSGNRVLLKDIYPVNNELYEVFNEYAYNKLESTADEKWLESFDVSLLYNKEDFLDGLESEKYYCIYYTKDSLGISFPVVHAMGDHMEIEIPYSQLPNTD